MVCQDELIRTTVTDSEGEFPRIPVQDRAEIGSGDATSAADIASEGHYPVYGGNGAIPVATTNSRIACSSVAMESHAAAFTWHTVHSGHQSTRCY